MLMRIQRDREVQSLVLVIHPGTANLEDSWMDS